MAAKTIQHIRVSSTIDPFKTHCIVDVGSGFGNKSYMVGKCPTITKARGSTLGYYDTKRNTRLSVTEMLRLQGTDPHMFDFTCVSRSQLGAMAGNAMTVSLIKALLKQLLPAAGLRMPGEI